jgi:hypothetical protein
MAKQQRTMRIEQKGQLADMQALESKTDEELAAETRYKAMAQAILGARAAERYDAPKARAHFQKALASARPQERMQLRRMADASLALAERRAGDLKTATERLGVDAPSGRQLFAIRMLGIIAPPKSDGIARRIAGILIAIAFVIAVFAIGFGIVYGIGQAAGGLSVDLSIFYGVLLVLVVVGCLVYFGRRRQRNAKAKREQELAGRAGAK